MPQFGTVAHLIELAIQGERLNETLYQHMARRFSHYPEVQQFWTSYAKEENGHARWLENLRSRLEQDRLDQPTDAEVLRQAEQALNYPLERKLAEIRTLQDAYDIANEIEHAETNTVFEFLIGYFPADEQTQAFLRAQLNEHVARLMIDFPSRVGTGTLRRGIPASSED